MRKKGFILLLLVWIVFISCSQKPNPDQSQLTVVDGELMMIGPVRYQDILDKFPEWQKVHEEAETAADVIEGVQRIEAPLDILCFIGTWCSDSRYGVPPFMKLLYSAQNPNLQIELIAVDRQKDDPQHLGPKNDIERVPTFIVKQNGEELFRMIEFPRATFAEDLLNELARN